MVERVYQLLSLRDKLCWIPLSTYFDRRETDIVGDTARPDILPILVPNVEHFIGFKHLEAGNHRNLAACLFGRCDPQRLFGRNRNPEDFLIGFQNRLRFYPST